MHPVLFTFPNGFSLHWYGVLIAAGSLVAVWLGGKWSVKDGFDKDLFTDLGFWSILGGVAGARAEYIRVNWSLFRGDIGRMLNVRDGGLVFYGGLLAVLLVFGVMLVQRRLPAWKVLDILAPLIPLGIVFGRLGCFMAGCCFGETSDLPWAVTFSDPRSVAPTGVPLHPTQLYEAGYGAALFGLLTWMRGHKRFDGQLILTFLTLYPLLRSVNETFRGDDVERGFFLGTPLSNAQAISVGVAGAALFLLAQRLRAPRA